MATYTPPPYFPQGQLAPPDPSRYRKLKLIVAAIALAAILIIGASVAVALYLLGWV